jgi:glycerol dehydrogenase
VYSLVGDKIESSLKDAGVTPVWVEFNGQSSQEEVDRVCAIFDESGCDAILGAGGGKTLDTAKASAYYRQSPVIIVPTIAATDAPCSSLAVIYKEGEVPTDLIIPKNPDLVLVDAATIANAPVRTFVAGMGDAFATFIEARSCRKSGAVTLMQGLGTNSAYTLAELCQKILYADGRKAKLAVENKTVTRALENVLEADIYLSGVGFENNGCAVAHGLYNAISTLPNKFMFMHGECVAFGTFVQLVLENAPSDEIRTVLDFYYDIGLPMTKKQIGLDILTDEEWDKVVAAALRIEITHNVPFAVNADNLRDAIINADAIGAKYLSERV